MRYCKFCGMPVEDDDLFCTRCGQSLDGRTAGTSYESEEDDDDDDSFLYEGSAGGGAGYGMGRYREKKSDPKRTLLIISAICVLLVLGGTLFMLLSSSRGGEADRPGSGTASASAESGLETGGGSQQEDQAQPSAAGTQENFGNEDSGNKDSGNEDGRDAQEASGKAAPVEEDSLQSSGADREEKAASAVRDTREEEEDESVTIWDEEEESPVQEEPLGTDGSYILPDSDSRYYSREELEYMDDYSLQMAINEIYARHGRIFKTDSIREYFESKSWYRGTIEPEAFDGNEGMYFNEYESANREVMAKIRSSREEKAAPAQDTQSSGN